MNEPMTQVEEAPAGYRLGDPIELEDLLALPPDGRRYTRDDQGRLALMPPDDADHHGYPLTRLTRRLNRVLDDPWVVAHERQVAFEPIYDTRGRVLRRSRLGKKAIEPDVALFRARPRTLPRSPGGATVFTPEGLALVVEVLSPSAALTDLGLGAGHDVDRWRTYLAAGVPEYWLINASPEEAGLPPRSALFLRNAGDRWSPLDVEQGLPAPTGARVHELTPWREGRVRSLSAAGLQLDLAAFWSELDA